MEYVGIDSSEVEIAFSKSYFKGNDKCRFILGDVEKIPYKENSFDLIFSRDVIIHTPNPYEMIKEMVRVTNKFLIFNARVTCLSNDITLYDKEKGHRYNTFSLKKFLRFLHKLSSHSLQIGYCFSGLSMPNINHFYWTRKYHYNIDFMRAGGWYFIDVMIKKNTEDKGVIIISNDTYNPRLNAMSHVKYSNMLRCLFQLFKDIVKEEHQ